MKECHNKRDRAKLYYLLKDKTEAIISISSWDEESSHPRNVTIYCTFSCGCFIHMFASFISSLTLSDRMWSTKALSSVFMWLNARRAGSFMFKTNSHNQRKRKRKVIFSYCFLVYFIMINEFQDISRVYNYKACSISVSITNDMVDVYYSIYENIYNQLLPI